MKRHFIDRLIGMVSPAAEARRLRARGQVALLARAYDAAQSFATDDWTSAGSGSANLETRGAQQTLRNKGRDAIRNNPYAGRGLTAIVSNTVGAGILPNIKGRSSFQTRNLQAAWKEWAESTLCDSTGKNNFYGLQALAMRSTVESGEVIALKEISTKAHSLRLLESDYIVSYRDAGGVNFKNQEGTIQGVKVDPTGKVISYYLYESHPGEIITYLGQREVPAENLCHVYRQDRPGQLRGVTWFYPVIRQLEDFNQYQQATLVSRKVSACFAAFVTTNDGDSTLSTNDLKAKRELDSMLEPGSMRYLSQGEGITLATPPKVDGYDEYCRQTLRAIASGLGISYEALTSDYSNVNFSSGRMGHLEFRRNVEMWRWSMLIPQFCDPAFKHFLQWAALNKGIVVDGVTVEWVPPAWSMIDPEKEIAAATSAIRSGLTSWPKAVREQGYDPDELLEEIAESNDKFDSAKVILDSDPRKITKAGLLQIEPASASSNENGGPSSGQDNKEVPPNGTPKKSD